MVKAEVLSAKRVEVAFTAQKLRKIEFWIERGPLPPRQKNVYSTR